MFSYLLRHLLRPPVPTPLPLPADDSVVVEVDEPQRGCGWFDSSHELQAGLQVMEHASADAAAAVLPLGDWLALHLGSWQPQPGQGCAA